ncbi:MAG: gamma-glutamylcyclotransferase family protein, partial [Solirubrobacteraceae bacterium]
QRVSELYFAYASNMASQTMSRLCPGHRFCGVAELPDHRLAFTRRSIRTGTGVADIVSADGQSVWGVLYELDAEMLAVLDEKEGNGWAYRRQLVTVRGADGEQRAALAYSVIAREPDEVGPSPQYLCGVLDAARERRLPEHYVEALSAMWAPL